MVLVLNESNLNEDGKNLRFEYWDLNHFSIDVKMMMMSNFIIATKEKKMRILKQRWDLPSFSNSKKGGIIPLDHITELISEIGLRQLGTSSLKPGTKKLKER